MDGAKMTEITALPGQPIPGTPFRRDQPVIYRGDVMIFLAYLPARNGAKLWHGSGWNHVPIEEIGEIVR
jgi:hypothetical protein